jgi:hypothetical protein
MPGIVHRDVSRRTSCRTRGTLMMTRHRSPWTRHADGDGDDRHHPPTCCEQAAGRRVQPPSDILAGMVRRASPLTRCAGHTPPDAVNARRALPSLARCAGPAGGAVTLIDALCATPPRRATRHVPQARPSTTCTAAGSGAAPAEARARGHARAAGIAERAGARRSPPSPAPRPQRAAGYPRLDAAAVALTRRGRWCELVAFLLGAGVPLFNVRSA